MKKIIGNLRNNVVFKRILYFTMIIFLFLYVFSIPSFSGRPVWFILSYILMGALSASVVLYTFLYTKFEFNRRLILPGFFAIFAFVGTVIYSHEFRIWLTVLLMFVTLVVFYYSFVAINNKRLIFKIFVYAFLAFGLYFAFIYRSQIIHLQLTSSRLGNYFDNVNTVGFYFAIAFSFSLYLALFYKNKREWLYYLPALLFFALGFFTGSRAFLFVAAIGAIVAMYNKFKKHKFIFFICLGALIGLFFIIINIPALAFLKDQFDRTLYTLFGIGNFKVDGSTVQRTIWPGYAFYLGGRSLVFGYGCGGFAIYSGIGTYSHNNFAEIMCNFGMVGFIVFNLCYIIPLIRSIKSKSEEIVMVPILFFVFFSRSFFGVIYYSKEAYLVLALLYYLTKDCPLPKFRISIQRNKHKNNISSYEVSI